MGSAPPSHDRVATYQLSIKDVFDSLSQNEKLYAHHLSQAAWHGSRIILRQTSPEGIGIFDFILELHKACQGQWTQFVQRFGISAEELDDFLDFAGMFMSRLNNFCVAVCPGTWQGPQDYRLVLQGGGDRKIVPNVSAVSLRKMASISSTAAAALKKVIESMLSITLTALGLRLDVLPR